MQTFFLVILPGLGLTLLEVLPPIVAVYAVARWLHPYCRRLAAARRRDNEATRRAMAFTASARPVVAELVVALYGSERLAEAMPTELQEQLHQLNDKDVA